MPEVIAVRPFTPADLNVPERGNGVSAFMRIRNGADFLEMTIRSHIPYFDEIVAVYNQCTDGTPGILERLEREYGGRLRVFHYPGRVFPAGSRAHASTPAGDPRSIVNYYNTSLSLTRFRYAVKLDDDHLAIPAAVSGVVESIRAGLADPGRMHCFSGLNLARGESGELGVYPPDPVSGSGDIGFFPVSEETYFVHDRRFERFRGGGLKRVFAGYLYWHLKYLKPGMGGFKNYELDDNPDSRYLKKRDKFSENRKVHTGMQELGACLRKEGKLRGLLQIFSEKARLNRARDRALIEAFGGAGVREALVNTVQREWSSELLG